MLAIWLAVIFALGGSSRPDMPSLLVLRPASILMTGAGLWTLTGAQAARFKRIFGFVAATMALIALHLVPLPPAVWSALPGRELIAEIDQATGLAGAWRPLSMAPPWTWNALWFMFTPLSVLVHAAQLSTGELRKLGGVLLLLGLVSALLGIAQIAGGNGGSLYLYSVTHTGVSVGLFANRNHQALLLATLVPIALVWLRHHPVLIRFDQQDTRKVDLTNAAVAVLLGALFPLVLASGSRAGLAIAIVSVVVSLVVLPPRRANREAQSKARRGRLLLWPLLAVLGGLAITGIALKNDRALSIERLVELDPRKDFRSRVLPPVFLMIRHYAPVGSGIGTFEPVYQIDEPDELLDPEYANHVHSDWLEVALTAGVPGLLLLGCAVVAWLVGAWRCISAKSRRQRPEHELAIAGLLAILLTGIASITDYPLRTPSLSAVLVVLILWIDLGLSKQGSYQTDDGATTIAADAVPDHSF